MSDGQGGISSQAPSTDRSQPLWEYLLFVETAAHLAQARLSDAIPVAPPPCADLIEASHRAVDMLDGLTAILSGGSVIFTDIAMEAAFGLPGEAGSEEQIVGLAERFDGFRRSLHGWRAEVEGTLVPPAAGTLFERLLDISEAPLQGTEAMLADFTAAVLSANDALTRGDRPQTSSVTLDLVLDPDPSAVAAVDSELQALLARIESSVSPESVVTLDPTSAIDPDDESGAMSDEFIEMMIGLKARKLEGMSLDEILAMVPSEAHGVIESLWDLIDEVPGSALTLEPPPRQCRTPEDVERAVLDWVQHWGYADARLTRRGPDGGVDIRSSELVIQVKAMSAKIGRPPVQQLAGIASTEGRSAAFFSWSTYTEQAVSFARTSGVALFIVDMLGRPTPVNDHAVALSG